jgi:phosphonoacetate hydrolase
VLHHGALGSFAQVHMPTGHKPDVTQVINFLRELPGVTEVLDQATAAQLMELPVDRMGDVVVCSGRDVVLGRTREWHDFSAIKEGLRSHGGRYEEMVPFFCSAPLKPEYRIRAQGDLRNFDLFDFACNGMIV